MVGHGFNEEIENMLTIDSSGNVILPAGMGLLTIDPLLGIGYTTGCGGTVTQGTSKATAVTINKPCGVITMHGAQLNDTVEVAFTVNNSLVAATDVIMVNLVSGATSGKYLICVGAVAAGSFEITLSNDSGGNLTETPVVNFVLIKAVSS